MTVEIPNDSSTAPSSTTEMIAMRAIIDDDDATVKTVPIDEDGNEVVVVVEGREVAPGQVAVSASRIVAAAVAAGTIPRQGHSYCGFCCDMRRAWWVVLVFSSCIRRDFYVYVGFVFVIARVIFFFFLCLRNLHCLLMTMFCLCPRQTNPLSYDKTNVFNKKCYGQFNKYRLLDL